MGIPSLLTEKAKTKKLMVLLPVTMFVDVEMGLFYFNPTFLN